MESQTEDSKQVRITIDDVDLCVRVLEMFLDRYRTVQNLLSELAEQVSRNKSLEEKIAEMILKARFGNQNIETETIQNIELTEEERKRIEELKKKYLEGY